MVELRHGGLLFDVPEGWSDQSQLLFVAPPDPNQLPTALPVQQPADTIAINFVFGEDLDARELLESQAEKLVGIDGQFEVLDQAEFECGLGPGWSSVQRLHLGEAEVRQLSVACVVGSVAVLATASAVASRFDRCEPALRRALESMRAAGGDDAPKS